MERKLRWGILGAAQIARKNWKAIRNSGNSTVVAVASRDQGRGRQFVNECQREAPMEEVPRTLESYQALVESPDVDALYIPLPTAVRKEWVVRGAATGKHILCEKPCAMSVQDLAEMVEACRRNRVQFMDGVMFMHSARLPALTALIGNDAGIGQVRRVTSAFSFSASAEFFKDNIRVNSALEPFGCLGDLGWYCLRFSLCLMDGRLPLKARGHMIHSSTGHGSPDTVPTEFSGELLFEEGVSAGFFCSFHTATEQWAQVTGTSGILSVSDFVLPFFGAEVEFHVNRPVFNVTGCDFNLEEHRHRYAVAEYSNSQPTSQETNMIRSFVEQARSGSLNEGWPDIALKTQAVMGACLDSARADGRWVSVRGAAPGASLVSNKTARSNP